MINGVFQFGKNFVLDDFFDDERYGEDQCRTDCRECFRNNFRAWRTRQEMNMATFVDGVQHFECQPVHVRHRQHTDDVVSRMDERQPVAGKLRVAPQAAVGDHDSFRETGRAGSIVQDSQFFRVLDMIFHIVGGKGAGVFLTEIFVDTVTHGTYFLVLAVDDGEVVQHHEQFDIRHLLFVHVLPVSGACQYGFSPRMVDDVMDIVGFEFMQNRYSDGSVSQYSKEADRPVGGVTADDGYFVAFPDSGMFQ